MPPCKETLDQEAEFSVSQKHSPCSLLPPYPFLSITLPEDNLYPDLCNNNIFSCSGTFYNYIWVCFILWIVCVLAML